MLTLDNNSLWFEFPEVHRFAGCAIAFNRTLRIPDHDQHYPLPPKLGTFPISLVDDHAELLPPEWVRHGGVFLPMYTSEALWISFEEGSRIFSKMRTEQLKRLLAEDDEREPSATEQDRGDAYAYPCAIKLATGKINAVTGEPWRAGLHDDPQDYVVVPHQRWLDGYNVSKGCVRQFVATHLGDGRSVEEQLTGAAIHGGLQVAVYPMKSKAYDAYCQQQDDMHAVARARGIRFGFDLGQHPGLAAGGLITQEILADRFDLEVWDQTRVSRCFVHLLNTADYQIMTGHWPPRKPFSARDYAKAGLPWFHAYCDEPAVDGVTRLSRLQNLASLSSEANPSPVPADEPLGPLTVRILEKGAGRRDPG